MKTNDADLLRWLHRRSADLGSATLAQLITLLELTGAASVSAISRGVSGGVNYRQKLARLEEALGVGKLTRRVGVCSQPTETGKRVAAEFRIFLQELRALDGAKAPVPTWIVGAGDAWLIGAIVPALTEMSQKFPEWRWEVKNLRSMEIITGLRDGRIQFGFVRKGDALPEGFVTGSDVTIDSYRVVVGDAENAPKTAKELIRWAIEKKRPLVQQGTTWATLSERADKTLKLSIQLSRLTPQVVCESYPEALAAAESGASWCIVPSVLGRTLAGGARSAIFEAGNSPEVMRLVKYDRAVRKHAGSDKAWDELRRTLRGVVFLA